MTNEEIVQRIQRLENVSENCSELYIKNLGMIRRLASRFNGMEENEDLCQEAFFGLVKAAALWDPSKECSFLTYSVYWIRQSMFKYIQEHSKLVRIPSSQHNRMYLYKRAANSISVRFGRDPEPVEIMALLDLNREQYDQLLKDIRISNPRSTNEIIGA